MHYYVVCTTYHVTKLEGAICAEPENPFFSLIPAATANKHIFDANKHIFADTSRGAIERDEHRLPPMSARVLL
jgi:hypothetical protein